MPENEFEKKVQQRMEELRFTPSDEVWKEVEHRIRKEKKKRRFIFWLPLLFLLLGGGLVTAIWVADNDGNHIAKSDRKVNKLQPNHPTVQSRPENNTSFSKGNIEKAITPKKETGKNIIKENAGNYLKKSFIFGKRSLPKNKLLVKEKGTELDQPVIKEIITGDIVAKNSPDKQNNVPEVKDNTNFNQPVNQQNDSTVSIEIAGRKNDKPEIQKQNNESIKDSIANAATEEKKPIHLNKKSMKWQWGIMIEKGRSQTADGFKLFDNKPYAVNLFAAQNSGIGSPVYNASGIHPSGSFALGVFVRRSVSSGFDINLGLNYLFLSTKMNVGSRVDSSRVISNSFSSITVDNFYRASNSNSSYINRYHFLSLSAELSWKIINSKTMPVFWNSGFSYGRLLSSNALHFDRNIPGYYKDFGLLTHNHFFLSTGFSVPVFKRFIINPFAEYSLTHVLRNTDSSHTHFTNYGVRINFFLKNKK
jgi:hypothetical protein